MSTKNLRITALALFCALLLPALAACGGGTDTPAVTQANNVTEDAVTTEETTTGILMPDLPDKDFGGETFTILDSSENDTNGADWVTYDVYSEGENGDAINDAVFARNLWLSETYNVVIAEKKSVSTTLSDTQKAVLAGDDIYDAVMTNISASATLAQNGQTWDMYEIPYIELTNPWWDQNAIETLSIAGHMNYATGDITVIDNDATWVLMFNKQLAENLNLDSFYDRVNNDQWHYDYFEKLTVDASLDLNGDGVLKCYDDQYGMVTTNMTAVGIFYSSGLMIAGKDENDLPVLALDTNLAATVVERTAEWFTNKNVVCYNGGPSMYTSPAEVREAFQNGQGLFYGEVMQCIIRMRQSETDFGLIPWPKYTENQDRYYNFAHATATKMITVPLTQTDLEMAGVVLEAMAAKSKYTLTPAYYDISMNNKYMRDEESIAMMDIILESRCFDLGYVYDWGSLFSKLHSKLYNNTGGNFSSIYAACEEPFNTAMQKTIDAYLAAEN